MTDKELLELAAKAAGIDGRYASLDEFPDWMTCHDGEGIYFTGSQAWNPLTDDGDALRLAVKLGLNLEIRKHYPAQTQIITRNKEESLHGFYVGVSETHDNDPYAATRRAIVRAAAEIGKNN